MQRGCQDLQPSSCTASTGLTYSSATELGKWFLFSSSVSFPHRMCIFSRMSCWCNISWEGKRIFWRAATRYSHDWTLQSFWPERTARGAGGGGGGGAGMGGCERQQQMKFLGLQTQSGETLKHLQGAECFSYTMVILRSLLGSSGVQGT